MPEIFKFTNYREYLAEWIAAQGDQAYGLKGKIAQSLGISSSLLSQVLKGEKTFTADQASDVCDYLRLNEIESDYFHLLVEKERAGNPRYREKLERKLRQVQQQSEKIGKRVPRHRELTDEQKSIYYSNWLYTGIRNLTAIEEFQTADRIAQHLRCDIQLANRILKFLLENGLCREENGRLTYGPASTHVDSDSPFVNKHHQNWRVQALQKMELRGDRDLFFTSPMSLSKEVAEEVRKMIPQFIQNVMKAVGPSPSETTRCLNIDWYEY